MNKYYYVYVLSSISGVLYIGVTNDLIRRVGEHKLLVSQKEKRFTNEKVLNFTTRYNVNRLVYFEQHESAEAAIIREKQLKGWRREKKIFLVKTNNPQFQDLYYSLLG